MKIYEKYRTEKKGKTGNFVELTVFEVVLRDFLSYH